MNRRQEYLFGLIKEIRDICDANGIQYFIGSGTLLGAVRNGGFLPWDDDADIFMTPDNFARFAEACKTDLPPNRYLGYPEGDDSYGHLLPRYISRDTTAIHTAQSLNDCVAGELIDIFLLDPIADGQEAYDRYKSDLGLCNSLVSYSNVSAYRLGTDEETYAEYDRIQQEQGVHAARMAAYERLNSNHSEEGEWCVLRWQGATIRFPRECVKSATAVTFEGETFSAPIGINRFLTSLYGEEWIEVPSKIAAAKHEMSCSLDFPYTEALEFYHPKYDRGELLEKMRLRRHSVLKHAPEGNRQKDEVASARAYLMAQEAQAIVAANQERFDRAYEEKDGKELYALLHLYCDWQASASAIGRTTTKDFYRRDHPVIAPVPDKLFQGGLLALMANGRVNHAHVILNARRLLGMPFSEEMEAILAGISLYTVGTDAVQAGDIEKALDIAKELCGEFPSVALFEKLRCLCLRKLYEGPRAQADLDAFASQVAFAEERFPGDGVFIKFQGDIQRFCGKDDDAAKLYLQAAESTHNGLALNDIAQRTGYYPSWLRNPAWAKEAGVPQWEGKTPEPARASAKPANKLEDPPLTLLGTLLKELTAICDKGNIPYFLSPGLTVCLSEEGKLAGKQEDYVLYCAKSDIQQLQSLVQKALDSGQLSQRVVRMRENKRMDCDELVFEGENSLFCDFGDLNAENELGGLRVCVQPQEGLIALPSKRKGKKTRSVKSLGLFTVQGKVNTSKLKRINTRWGSLSVVAGEREFYEACLQNNAVTNFEVGDTTLCSSVMSYKQLVDAGEFDPTWFDRRSTLREQTKTDRETFSQFRFNFAQIKLAVCLKQLSLELLPKKEQLLQLDAKGDYKALKKELKPYLECEKKFSKYGKAEFDPELYEVLQRTKNALSGKGAGKGKENGTFDKRMRSLAKRMLRKLGLRK